MKNLNFIIFCLAMFFLSACGGGGGGGTTSGSSAASSTPVIDSGGSGTLSGTVTVSWTYPTGTNVEGFRLYCYDDSTLTTETFSPKSSDGPTDLDVSFDASELGSNGDESFYFVVEAYRGTETARSASACYTANGGMGSCS